MSPLENISVDFLDFWVGQIEEGRRGTIRPVTGRRRRPFFKSSRMHAAWGVRGLPS
jgi:hypothetical protein